MLAGGLHPLTGVLIKGESGLRGHPGEAVGRRDPCCHKPGISRDLGEAGTDPPTPAHTAAQISAQRVRKNEGMQSVALVTVALGSRFSRALNSSGFPGGKERTCQRRRRRHGFNPWVQKVPWRREWQPSPEFLPGKAHGRRSLVGYVYEVEKSRRRLSTLTVDHLHGVFPEK